MQVRTLALASVLVAAGLLSSPAWAASAYSETFDGQGNLAGWFPNTIHSTVVNPGGGGNPGGYLLTRRSGDFPIGAATDLAAATGSFGSTPWTAKVDLKGVDGKTSDVWLRFRFQDSSFNGWRYRLTGFLGSDWQTFSVGFDPTWRDLQAKAMGWETDLPDGFASVSWAQTMGDVYTTEIRVEGSRSLLVGIDNVMLTPVPEPGTYALMALGLAALGWQVRRRTQAAA
jgi:hypothetical protein